MVKKKSKKPMKKSKKTTKKSSGKKEDIYYNNILKGFFILFGIVFLVIFGYYGISLMLTNFTYEGVDFKIIQEGDLIFYNTAFPVVFNGESTEYNFYLRNDPRDLNVPFEGNIKFKKNMVINSTGDLTCDGYGIIAVANIVNLYKILDTNVIKDENSTCDEEGRYIFLQINEGNETKIEQFGPACYNIQINNCEILEATEKFMVETFIKINQIL